MMRESEYVFSFKWSSQVYRHEWNQAKRDDDVRCSKTSLTDCTGVWVNGIIREHDKLALFSLYFFPVARRPHQMDHPQLVGVLAMDVGVKGAVKVGAFAQLA